MENIKDRDRLVKKLNKGEKRMRKNISEKDPPIEKKMSGKLGKMYTVYCHRIEKRLLESTPARLFRK